MNILLGVTGSVATIKLPALHEALHPLGRIQVVATDSALKIIQRIKGYKFIERPLDYSISPVHYGWGLTNLDVRSEEHPIKGFSDEDEWLWESIGDKVLHIDLKDWADILVIAPLTANTLAKIANGLCDNLLTCICRAWRNKPIVLAPAMNTDMWNHPLTVRHLSDIKLHYITRRHNINGPQERVFVVNPVEKKLACGTTGMGAMAPVEDIAQVVRSKV